MPLTAILSKKKFFLKLLRKWLREVRKFLPHTLSPFPAVRYRADSEDVIHPAASVRETIRVLTLRFLQEVPLWLQAAERYLLRDGAADTVIVFLLPIPTVHRPDMRICPRCLYPRDRLYRRARRLLFRVIRVFRPDLIFTLRLS